MTRARATVPPPRLLEPIGVENRVSRRAMDLRAWTQAGGSRNACGRRSRAERHQGRGSRGRARRGRRRGARGRRGADDLAVGARVRGFARRAAPADATFEAGVAGAGIGGGHGRGEGEGYRWGFDGGEAGGLG